VDCDPVTSPLGDQVEVGAGTKTRADYLNRLRNERPLSTLKRQKKSCYASVEIVSQGAVESLQEK
jgi:hypothetical protein